MSFTTGTNLRLTVFGASHGHSVNAVLDGFPSGFKVDREQIQRWLMYRKPGLSEITTQRKEQDQVEILSGIREDITDGSPIFFSIKNSDAISSHYDEIRNKPRPGHADLTMWYKYGEARNSEGGGFFSGRMTAPIVAAGSLCLQLLNSVNISVVSWQKSIGNVSIGENIKPDNQEYCYSFATRIPDSRKDQEAHELIRKIMKEGNSIGGIIDTTISGILPGIGEPLFDSVESTISKLMFSIPGLKGIEFGSGFNFGKMTGKEAMDSISTSKGKIITETNHNGGILGGLTNGMPVTFSVVMKPTSSIRSDLKTVDLKTGKDTTLNVKGRHDPCISIRAVPVVQTLSAFAMCDLILQNGDIPKRFK